MEDHEFGELRSAEDVNAAYGQLATDVRGLHEAGNLTKERVEELATKVETLQRASLEIANTRDMGSVGNDERDMMRRYVDEDGKLHLRTRKRTVTWAGKQHEVEVPGLLDDKHRACEWQDDLQNAWSERAWVRQLMRDRNGRVASTPISDGKVISIAMRAPKAIQEKLERAMDGTTSGSGAEWVDDGFIPQLYRVFETPSELAAAFENINVSSETFKRPRITVGATPAIRGAVTTDTPSKYTASTPTTADTTFVVPALAVRVVSDEFFSEDAAIASQAQIAREIQRAIRQGYEDAMVVGDLAGTRDTALASWNPRGNWDPAVADGGAGDHRRVFDGLREQAFTASTTLDMGALQSSAGLLQLKALMGERGVGRAVLIVSPEVMVQVLMGLAEVITIDKFGPAATIVGGALANIFGDPIIVSRSLTADLNASGIYDNVTTTKSAVLYADAMAWSHYSRRDLLLEVDKEISSGHFEHVGTLRRLFATPGASTEPSVAYGFNWL